MNLKVVKNLSFALFFLYFFLVSIKLLEKGIKTLGAEYTDQLFESVSNPFAGLLVGILCTVLVQSSSVTTSTIVGLVGICCNHYWIYYQNGRRRNRVHFAQVSQLQNQIAQLKMQSNGVLIIFLMD